MVTVFALSMLRGVFSDTNTTHLIVFQSLALCMPFITGVLFLLFAPTFASIVCRLSQIGEEAFTAVISPETAIVVSCVITGLTLGVQKIPEFAQFAVQQILAAANPAYAAMHQGQDFRILIIGPALYTILSMTVLFKARALARWLMSRYEKA